MPGLCHEDDRTPSQVHLNQGQSRLVAVICHRSRKNPRGKRRKWMCHLTYFKPCGVARQEMNDHHSLLLSTCDVLKRSLRDQLVYARVLLPSNAIGDDNCRVERHRREQVSLQALHAIIITERVTRLNFPGNLQSELGGWGRSGPRAANMVQRPREGERQRQRQRQ
jgi:hypothetical protein